MDGRYITRDGVRNRRLSRKLTSRYMQRWHDRQTAAAQLRMTMWLPPQAVWFLVLTYGYHPAKHGPDLKRSIASTVGCRKKSRRYPTVKE